MLAEVANKDLTFPIYFTAYAETCQYWMNLIYGEISKILTFAYWRESYYVELAESRANQILTISKSLIYNCSENEKKLGSVQEQFIPILNKLKRSNKYIMKNIGISMQTHPEFEPILGILEKIEEELAAISICIGSA